MNTLLITYDLIAPSKDYESLWDFLKSQSKWAKPVRSVFLVKTTNSAKEFRDALKSYIDSDDKVLVVDVTGDATAWKNLPDNIARWIKDNV